MAKAGIACRKVESAKLARKCETYVVRSKEAQLDSSIAEGLAPLYLQPQDTLGIFNGEAPGINKDSANRTPATYGLGFTVNGRFAGTRGLSALESGKAVAHGFHNLIPVDIQGASSALCGAF